MADIKSRQTFKAEMGGHVQYGTIATGTAGRWVAFETKFSGSPSVTVTRKTGGMTAQAGTVTTSGLVRVSQINPGSFKLAPDSGTPLFFWQAIDGRTNL